MRALLLSWPTFTTATNEAVASGSMTLAIGADGSGIGETCAECRSDPGRNVLHGGVSPERRHHEQGVLAARATTTTTIANVRAQVMPVALAVQT